MTDDVIPARLREAREHLGLTAERVNAATGWAPGLVGAMEEGAYRADDEQLARLAAIYMRPVAWFRDEHDWQPDAATLRMTEGLCDEDSEAVLDFAEFLSGAGKPERTAARDDRRGRLLVGPHREPCACEPAKAVHFTVYPANERLYGACGTCGQPRWVTEMWRWTVADGYTPQRSEHCGCCTHPHDLANGGHDFTAREWKRAQGQRPDQRGRHLNEHAADGRWPVRGRGGRHR